MNCETLKKNSKIFSNVSVSSANQLVADKPRTNSFWTFKEVSIENVFRVDDEVKKFIF